MVEGIKTVKLYSAQNKGVIDIIKRDGSCFNKRKYVEEKYGESAKVFLAAYNYFAVEAAKRVIKPEQAEIPYWTFMDLINIEASSDTSVLVLKVPVDEVVFFDMHDWIKVLKLQYLGKDQDEENIFRKELGLYGIKRESDIILTEFYPDLKKAVIESWSNLFQYDKKIKTEKNFSLPNIQGGIWEIKSQWIEEILD